MVNHQPKWWKTKPPTAPWNNRWYIPTWWTSGEKYSTHKKREWIQINKRNDGPSWPKRKTKDFRRIAITSMFTQVSASNKTVMFHPFFWYGRTNLDRKLPRLELYSSSLGYFSVPIGIMATLPNKKQPKHPTSSNTLPETNSKLANAPKNGWLEYYFPIGMAYFQVLC